MHCRNCKSSDLLKKKFNFDFYTYKNFNKISEYQTYIECKKCKIIYSNRVSFLKKLYKKIFSKDYLGLKFKDLELIPKFNSKSIYHHFFVGELKKKNNIKILDYGNSSIIQLKDYSNFFYNSKIYFYDITVKKDFFFYNNKTKTTCILTNNLKKIDQKIDLIISFNSLQYYLNYKSFFKFIKKISYLKTKMYVVTPSIDKNKYFLLLGDEYFKFSKIGLTNFLQKNLNKKTKFINRKYLSSSNFVLIDFSKKKISKKLYKSSKLNMIDKFLKHKSQQINKLKLKKKTFIFGTRVNSFFISKYINNSTELIDDQENKSLRKYKLLDDISNKNISILIPYTGIKYEMIKKILIKKKFKNFFQA